MGKGASAKQEVNQYRMSLHYGVCLAPSTGVTFKSIKIDDKVIWSGSINTVSYADVNMPGLFGGETKEGGVAGRIYFLPGRDDQVLPEELARRFTDENGTPLTSATAPAFRGVASVFFVGSPQSFGLFNGITAIDQGGFYWTANSPFIRPVKIEVECPWNALGFHTPMVSGNINGACAIYEALTNRSWGMGGVPSLMNTASFTALAQLLHDETFQLSLQWRDQTRIEDFINEIIDHVQATVFVDPRTGLLTVKALRDDYNINDLREINPGNARLKRFERKLWGETVNELVGTWTNPVNEQEETVARQDIGNIEIQGGVVSDNRNYYAVRSAELLGRLLDRDLRAASAPLATFEAHVDRTFYDVVPGQVVRVTWPRHNLSNVICRVMKVGYGKKKDGRIKLSLMQDIFSLSKPPLTPAPSTGWQGQQELPAPIDKYEIITLPYYLAQRQVVNQVSAPTYPEVMAGILAYREGQDTVGYDLYGEEVQANGSVEWRTVGTKSVVGWARLITPMYQEPVTLAQGLPLIGVNRGPEVGSLVFFGTGGDTEMEIGLLRSYDNGTWTVDRGLFDTIPKAWPVDTPVWFVPLTAVISDDANYRSVGETVEYKMLTRTSLGSLDLNAAPLATGTMTARPHAPLRPANVKINGTAIGEVDATAATNLTITWANRNRLFEDGQVTKWEDGSATPEYKQQTVITVFRQNGAKMFQIKGLWTETSKVIPIAHVQQESRVFIRVSSERDGISSTQGYGLWVKNIPQIANPSAPPADDLGGPAPPPPAGSGDPTPLPVAGTEPVPPPRPGGGGAAEWKTPRMQEV